MKKIQITTIDGKMQTITGVTNVKWSDAHVAVTTETSYTVFPLRNVIEAKITNG